MRINTENYFNSYLYGAIQKAIILAGPIEQSFGRGNRRRNHLSSILYLKLSVVHDAGHGFFLFEWELCPIAQY